MDAVMEHDLSVFETEERVCGMADELLKILAEKRISVKDSRLILEKMGRTLEMSVESLKLGDAFTCVHASNEVRCLNREAVEKEFNRRKVQEKAPGH